MTPEEGSVAVSIAREAAYAEGAGRRYVLPSGLPEVFFGNSGVFVTVLEHPSRDLRACIGYSEPVMPLGEAVVVSAAGAVHDPRFPMLYPDEAKKCLFEVTVLTPSESVAYRDIGELCEKVKIGRDGLIAGYRGHRALFLPQVPVEQGWNFEQYVSQLCLKADLPPDMWRSGKMEFETFRGEIFEETEPLGKVVRREQDGIRDGYMRQDVRQ